MITCDRTLTAIGGRGTIGGACSCGDIVEHLHFVEGLPLDPPYTMDLLCVKCCPVCRRSAAAWVGAPKTITGTQEGLFNAPATD